MDLLLENAQLVDRLREHHRRSESESNVKKIARVQKQRAQRQEEHFKHTSRDPTVQEYEYLGLPETASMARCIAAYRQATGSAALRKATCGSCAHTDFERVMHPDVFNYSLAGGAHVSLPARHLLAPQTALPTQHTELSDGLLLHQPALDKNTKTTRLCRQCHTALTKKNPKTPPMALASGLWIGEVPEELKDLTLPESLLIARAFPRAYVVKLRRKMGGGDPTTMMDGLMGNVSSVEMPHPQIDHMLAGKYNRHLPQPVHVLSDVLSIAFLSFGSSPPTYLHGFLAVHRHVVHRALLWLKRHNAQYADIYIDPIRLQQLPLDGVPPEIVVRTSPSTAIADFGAREGTANWTTDDQDWKPGGEWECDGIPQHVHLFFDIMSRNPPSSIVQVPTTDSFFDITREERNEVLSDDSDPFVDSHSRTSWDYECFGPTHPFLDVMLQSTGSNRSDIYSDSALSPPHSRK